MVKKRGLGRGLDALIGASSSKPVSTTPGTTVDGDSEMRDGGVDGQLRQMSVDLIQRGKYQPRIDMHTEALQDLANSIKAQGVVQPIVVRPIGGGRFEIIAGERRWRATQLAGLHEIPVIIRDVPDEAAVAMALIENIQREELNPMEEANALQRLIDEFNMTHQQAADAVGRSRVAVSNLLRLQSLAEEVKRMLVNGDLEMGHARALLPLEGNEQLKAARIVVAKSMSVRETERLVKKIQIAKEHPEQKVSVEDPNIRSLEERISERLGAKIKIAQSGKGKGRLEIYYNSLDELDGILAHIK
ncbi:MAG: ParB/RepB/Spo0J family partition protein [Gammaproteobacteria bacterium]|nr:ParB/RepB/Spo0J family partition protein [Gammaproteobacteria bacterium]